MGGIDFWGYKNLVGGESTEEEEGSFSRWEGMSKFSAGSGDCPHPPLGKTLHVATANCMVYLLFHFHKP